MAEAANAENVNQGARPPDYRYAVQQIRGNIEKKKDRISSINGEIADVFAKIESRGVNKKGARIFAMLDKLEGPERLDVLRTVNGMCDASGWPDDNADLADQAEGNVVRMRVGKTADAEDENERGDGAAAGDDDQQSDDDDDDNDDEEAEPSEAAGRLSPQEAMQAARERFAGGKRPELTTAFYTQEQHAVGPDIND